MLEGKWLNYVRNIRINMSIKRISRGVHFALSLPKTLFFCFRVFPLRIACKVPVFVDYRTKFYELHSGTVVLQKVKIGIVKIGWGEGSIGNECNRNNYWCVKKNCKVVFDGKVQFARGVTIRNDNCGEIIFGNRFTANQNFFCASNTSISFGSDVVLGWNVHVRDSDGHPIFGVDNGIVINKDKPIKIGNNVWLGSYSSILKGGEVSDDSVVAFGSIVTRKFSESNVIIGGVPASIIKRDIDWKK